MFFKNKLKKIYKNKLKKIKNNFNKKLFQERTKFINILNHDIKTPILAQIRSLELLESGTFGNINKQQKEILEQIINSHNYLYEIITNTLFLTKYENEKPKLNLEKINIIKEIEDCMELIKNYAIDKQQDIIIKTGKNKNINLCADKKLIQKIIFNLLANSISSGFEKSKIEISVKQYKNSISFSAKNKSIYMTKEKINSLFEEKTTLRDFNQIGMNLNLNIVKKLIEAHNWDIVAKSEKNNSATFGFIASVN